MSDRYIQAVVDAVGEALGVDTGTISEAKFERACEACRKAMASEAESLKKSQG